MLAVSGGGGFSALCVGVLPEVLVFAAGTPFVPWQPESVRVATRVRRKTENLMRRVMKW